MADSNTKLTPAQEAEILAAARAMLAGNTKIETPEECAAFSRELAVKAIANAAAVPLRKHGAFDDLRAHLEFIQLGCDALKGIGAMMQPEHGDHQLNIAHSSDAAAVFRFFGEAMYQPAIDAYSAKERLEQAAEGALS